jgi:hypothetical protein
MTTPTDKLRAIVEGRKCDCGGRIGMYSPDLDFCVACGKVFNPHNKPDKERILAQTLLAVLERCNEGADYLTVARERESIADLITTKLKEAGGL